MDAAIDDGALEEDNCGTLPEARIGLEMVEVTTVGATETDDEATLLSRPSDRPDEADVAPREGGCEIEEGNDGNWEVERANEAVEDLGRFRDGIVKEGGFERLPRAACG